MFWSMSQNSTNSGINKNDLVPGIKNNKFQNKINNKSNSGHFW